MEQREKSVGEQVMSKYSSDEEEVTDLNAELKKTLKELFWALLKLFLAILNLCCSIYMLYIFLKYYHVI